VESTVTAEAVEKEKGPATASETVQPAGAVGSETGKQQPVSTSQRVEPGAAVDAAAVASPSPTSDTAGRSVEQPGDPPFPTEYCLYAEHVMGRYSVLAMCAMFIQFFLIADMAVFSNELSAFMVVVKHVLAEITRFMLAFTFLILTFGSAISVLEHDQEEMQTIPQAAIALFAITVKLYQDDYRGVDEPAVVVTVFIYQTAVTIGLLNLLIAQLQCSYEFVYADAIGFARLARSLVTSEAIEQTPASQWNKFVESCKFDERLEFAEGDIGINGGIQVMEPARLHPIVEDTIQRFGGSTSPDQPWPETQADLEGENKFDRLERLLQKIIKRMVIADASGHGGSHGGSKGGSGAGNSGSGGSGQEGTSESSEEDE